MSLSQTVKTFQRQVSQNITMAQKDPVLGPGVQRLVGTYEAWESKLRSEAQLRLTNGLAPRVPPNDPRLTDGDWDLLKRVPRSLPSSSMKKSASADSLDSMAVTATGIGSASQASRGGSRLGGGRAQGVETTSTSYQDGGAGFGGGGGAYGGHSEASMYGPRLVPIVRHATGVGGAAAGGGGIHAPSDQQLLRLGIPRVPTAPSLQVGGAGQAHLGYV